MSKNPSCATESISVEAVVLPAQVLKALHLSCASMTQTLMLVSLSLPYISGRRPLHPDRHAEFTDAVQTSLEELQRRNAEMGRLLNMGDADVLSQAVTLLINLDKPSASTAPASDLPEQGVQHG